jgi:signal transduction histidine kinase/ActR/RegA family two-component response regulator
MQDREGRWHELRSQPYRDADGHVVGVVLAVVDIHALREAMTAATQARDYSAAIVEAVRHPMIVLDSALRILSANAQFWRKFRLTEATTVGTRLVDLPGDMWEEPALQQRLDELLRSGRDFDNLEVSMMQPDVGRRLFRISARQLQADSNVKNTLVAIEDVTDRRLLEERLQQAAKLQAMGQIAGGVAHEINNQMQVVMGLGRDLLQGTVLGPSWRQDVDHILAAAARSAEVTHNLLAFTRQQVLRPDFVTVDEMVEQMARLLPKILGPMVETVVSLGAGRRQVYADRAQLEQVFVNLALNARAAMPEGGRLLLATSAIEVDDDYGRHHDIAIQAGGPHVRILVRDAGHGMDATTLGRIFEPFFTTKPVGQGSGLGMASVYGTVKQSGGYVWVDSRPGEGATVTIDLPERIDKRAPPRRLSGPSLAMPRGSETILVVDDEEQVRSWICRGLETLGYAALGAADGPAALEILESGAGADLMLTDMIMPGMGGREVGARATELRPGLRVVFMSGHTRHEMITRGLLDEDAALLPKPFSLERLAAAIRETLDAERAPAGS